MTDAIKNILNFLRYHSLAEFSRRLLKMLAKLFYESTTRYVFSLKFDDCAQPNQQLQTTELVASDIGRMREIMYISRDDLQKRFEQGDRCFAILEQDCIVSFFWAHFGLKDFYELYLKISLNPNQAWFYNAITTRKFRGRGLYPNVIRYMAKVLKSSGIDECFIDVDSKNRASLRSLEKVGCVPLALIRMKKRLSKINYNITVFDNKRWNSFVEKIEKFDELNIALETGQCR